MQQNGDVIRYLGYIGLVTPIAIAVLIRLMRDQVLKHAPDGTCHLGTFRLMAAHRRLYPFSYLRIAMVATIVLVLATFLSEEHLIHKRQQHILATLQQYRLNHR